MENFKWANYVETQLKKLSDDLYKELRDSLIELRICPRAFTRVETQDTINLHFEHCISFFVGIRFSMPQSDQVHDLRPIIAQFALIVDMHRIDKETNDVRIMYYRQDQLC
jgi:hypothetical protein